MKLFWTIIALATATCAQGLEERGDYYGSQCKANTCLKALQGRRGARDDCNNYLAVTVTPRATTVYRTSKVTRTSTARPRVTVTVRSGITRTETISVTATSTVDVTQTNFDERTATATATTGTVTVTAQPPARRRQDQVLEDRYVKPTPRYASVCHSADAYRSACQCIGAVTRTTTTCAPTVTKTKTQTRTARPVTVPTTVATRRITSTSIVSFSSTFTTVAKSETVATVTLTRTTKTNTVDVAATETVQPPVVIRRGNIGLFLSGGGGFWGFYDSQTPSDSNAWRLDGGGGPAGSDVFTYDADTRSLTVFSSSMSPTAGYRVHYDPNGGAYGPTGGNGVVSFFAAVGPGSPNIASTPAVDCTIAADNKMQCAWGANGQVADLWVCLGFLSLVAPGADPSSYCRQDGINEKLEYVLWNPTT